MAEIKTVGVAGSGTMGAGEHHHDVSQALFEAYGDQAYAPARRARVAKRRTCSP